MIFLFYFYCAGVETHCDGRQNGIQCYGALGGTVVLQLVDSASEISKLIWKNKQGPVLDLSKGTIAQNVIATRSVFTPSNGTFRINNLSRTDADEYTLQIYDSNGRRTELRILQLIIQGK